MTSIGSLRDRLLLGAALVALLLAGAPLSAQEANAPVETATAAAEDDGAEAGLDPNEIDALVAPVVLYPDPLLALVLQASITPLDVVEAERFLRRREKDASLVPDPDWDPSVLGLLNYPDLITAMSEYLDWTQLLGGAVVDQLDAVQASIQVLREAAFEQGILASNEVQKVVVVNDLIVVAPVDKATISVPQYDPVQFLAALTPVDDVSEPEPAAPAAITPEPQPAAVAQAAEPPPSKPPEPVAPAPAPTAAPAPQAYAEPAPAPAPQPYVEPAPVTTYAAPTYAAPPPPVAYAAPQTSFWSTAATFAGGAAVGGLLGYVLGDDDNNDNDNDGWDDVEDAIRDLDDDDWDDFVDRIDDDDLEDFVNRLDDKDWDEVRDDWRGGRDVNISDSTIVVGNNVTRDQLNAKLKNKRDAKLNLKGGDRARLDLQNGTLKRDAADRAGRGDRVAGAEPRLPQGLAPANLNRDRPGQRPAALAQNRPAEGANRPKTRDVKLPGAGGATAATLAQTRPRPGGDANRAARPARPENLALNAGRQPGAQRPAPGNRGIAAGVDQPRQTRQEAQRGAASKAKAGLQKVNRAGAEAQRPAGGAKLAQQRQAANLNRGGDRPMGAVKKRDGVQRDADRGKKSLAKGGGGRRNRG